MDAKSFLQRRAAAYQAYYEHMPLPLRMRPRADAMRIYGELDWGRLARFHILDCRQYRAPQACPRPERPSGSNTVDAATCTELAADRSILGRAQEQWLEAGLAGSGAAWTVIAQTSRMAQFDQQPGAGRRAWTDAWDGYPSARRRLLTAFKEKRVGNPVVIGGDIHAFNVSKLKLDFDHAESPVVASEFVTTSITSQGWPQERVNRLLPDNPHILLADSRHRGYMRVDLGARRWSADLRVMESVQQRDAPCRTLASYVVEDGRPGPVRA